jgi:hypothetical protein
MPAVCCHGIILNYRSNFICTFTLVSFLYCTVSVSLVSKSIQNTSGSKTKTGIESKKSDNTVKTSILSEATRCWFLNIIQKIIAVLLHKFRLNCISKILYLYYNTLF